MLEELTIKNVAVIDKLSVEFGSGLSVLTGETGAGKSIIIDSINMILGDRAKKEIIRNGEDYAYVEAVFGLTDAVKRVLLENDIECDDASVIITRKITVDGKSTARINGCAVTLSILRDVADMLINIHGQHDNQALLSPNKHITFLDDFAKVDDELAAYKALYDKQKKLKNELSDLEMDESKRIERMDLLKYQVNEITTANLVDGEEDELLSQRMLLERAEEITESITRSVNVLYDSDTGVSAYDLLSEAQSALSKISDVGEAVSEAYEAITNAVYSVEEAARTVRDFGSSIEFDEYEHSRVEERLDLINRLKRKYGGSVADIIEYGKKAQAELLMIETSDERKAELEAELSALDAKLEAAADALSEKRKTAAKTLEGEILQSLYELNMEKAKFCVNITDKPYAPQGKDEVEFLISTNPGEDLKPLVKIASGGELSRVMLAIKSILAKSDSVDAMIFDEIDTGVSGNAAEKIAVKLKEIAKTSQVICITHLPQLASVADNHFLIEKDVEGEMARTSLIRLDTSGRIAELARIVGGGRAGEEYAKTLINAR